MVPSGHSEDWQDGVVQGARDVLVPLRCAQRVVVSVIDAVAHEEADLALCVVLELSGDPRGDRVLRLFCKAAEDVEEGLSVGDVTERGEGLQ